MLHLFDYLFKPTHLKSFKILVYDSCLIQTEDEE